MSAGRYGRRDGRKAHAYLLEQDTTKVAAGTLRLGHFYFISERGASSSLVEVIPPLVPFYCQEEMTVADDDEVFELKAYFLGFANNKSYTEEKQVNEATVDMDESSNYICEGSVAASGSISGYDMVGDPDSAVEKLKLRFNDTLDMAGDTPVYKESDTTRKDLIVLIWDAFGAKPGDITEMNFVPCYLTNNSKEAAYGSPQSLNLDFQGCDTTDEGIRRIRSIMKWAGIVDATAGRNAA